MENTRESFKYKQQQQKFIGVPQGAMLGPSIK